MIIRRVGPISCAKISGTLYAVIGFIIGVFFALVGMLGGFAARNVPGGGVMAGLGIGALVVFPILYGVIGFIFTLIAAWIYNLLAGVVGGIQIDVIEERPTASGLPSTIRTET